MVAQVDRLVSKEALLAGQHGSDPTVCGDVTQAWILFGGPGNGGRRGRGAHLQSATCNGVPLLR